VERKSKKSLKDFYEEDLASNPYKEVSLADMAESEDPEAMNQAVKQQKKARGYFDRLKSKLENK
jgi:hypothetical protein